MAKMIRGSGKDASSDGLDKACKYGRELGRKGVRKNFLMALWHWRLARQCEFRRHWHPGEWPQEIGVKYRKWF